MPQPGTIVYPHAAFRYTVEIAGITQAVFDECSGLSATTETYEFKEGGLNTYSHRLPGRTTWSNITLKRGMTDSRELWNWYMDVVTKKDKTSALKSVSIIQYKHDITEAYRWNLAKAFPVKWTGPSFNAANSSVAIESFEIAFGDVELVAR